MENKLNIFEGKFNITTNCQSFIFCKVVKSNVTFINSFCDIYENTDIEISNLNPNGNIVFNSLNSDIIVRNSQINNYSKLGKGFLLEDAPSQDDLIINNNDITELFIISSIMNLIPSENAKVSILNKLRNKFGLKINDINYKLSLESQESLIKITLDEDRHPNLNKILKNTAMPM